MTVKRKASLRPRANQTLCEKGMLSIRKTSEKKAANVTVVISWFDQDGEPTDDADEGVYLGVKELYYVNENETEPHYLISSDAAVQTVDFVSVTNTYATGELTVSKAVVSDSAADQGKEFTFTISLTDANGVKINGVYSGVQVEDGKAEITLHGGDSVTITGLPAGTAWIVSEAAAEPKPGRLASRV